MDDDSVTYDTSIYGDNELEAGDPYGGDPFSTSTSDNLNLSDYFKSLPSDVSGSGSLSDIIKGIGSLFGGTSSLGKAGQFAGLLGAAALANKMFGSSGGGGFAGYQGGIPSYTASRTMNAIPTTMTIPTTGGGTQVVPRRPGSGGITYFSPMVYNPQSTVTGGVGTDTVTGGSGTTTGITGGTTGTGTNTGSNTGSNIGVNTGSNIGVNTGSNTGGTTSTQQTGTVSPSSAKYGNVGVYPSSYISGLTPEQYAPYITPYEQYALSLANELKPGQFDFELTPRQMLAGTTNPDVVVAPTNWNSMTTDQRNAWIEQNAPASKYAAPQRLPQGVHDWVVANFIRDNRMNFDEYKNALGSITDVDFSKLPGVIQDALLYTEKYQLPRGVVNPEYVDESKFFQFKRADGSVQPMSPTIFYSSPATQVGYLNTIKITPDELLANGFTQDQINALKNAGYKSGLAEGGIASLYNIYNDYGLETRNKSSGKRRDAVNKSGISSLIKGHLGSYSDGGQLLRGPGDGVSDDIPATIADKQPARLADGEFVIPARIVSELGNGSTEAGARKLYAMMDRIKKARRSAKDIAADTKTDRYLPR